MFVDHNSEEDKDPSEEQILEEGGIDSSEEGFIKGYTEEEEVVECAECGSAINPEKKVIKEIDGETHVFCSKSCAKEFKESLASE